MLDLGAGLGALTAPLAATGAHVIAVERDERYARRLRHRFGALPNVTVVAADLRTVALPRRDFHVVANIPFATTQALLRRLLDPPRPALKSALLVVEAGAARGLCSWSRQPEGAWWGARFELNRMARLGREVFVPPPRVDAQVLAVTRVTLPAHAEAALRRLLRLARQTPGRPLRALLAGRLGPGELRGLGLDPRTPAGAVTGSGWRAVVLRLSDGRASRTTPAGAGTADEGPSRTAGVAGAGAGKRGREIRTRREGRRRRQE